MQKRRFGWLAELDLGVGLGQQVQVIQFEREGTPHTHDLTDEIAIAVSGSGVVVVDGERHPIFPGQFIRIGAGKRHHMIPDPGVVLSMLVGYGLDDLP